MEERYQEMKDDLQIDDALKMSDEEEPDPYIRKSNSKFKFVNRESKNAERSIQKRTIRKKEANKGNAISWRVPPAKFTYSGGVV
jgi:hypothetical protein